MVVYSISNPSHCIHKVLERGFTENKWPSDRIQEFSQISNGVLSFEETEYMTMFYQNK